MSPVIVVGVSAEGWDALSSTAQRLIETADVLVGGKRHLDLVPVIPAQTRDTWPRPLKDNLASFMAAYEGQSVVVVASGDPLVSGIATTLIDLLGPDEVTVIPAISSVALARAQMKWSAESVDVVTLVGRDHAALLRYLSPGRRLLVLSSDGSTPGAVAALIRDAGFGETAMSVLSDLGTPEQARLDGRADAWPDRLSPALNVIALVCARPVGVAGAWSSTSGLPDEAFLHDGQLTKRDLRASAMARLAPVPGELLWDVGAGAGSLAIEWMRSDPRCRAIAIEAQPERASRIAANASRLGVPGLSVVEGHAPEALSGLAAPDAIFIGGGATEQGLIDGCWHALRRGGRLVVHGVTMETEVVLAQWYAREGGELTRISIERIDHIGSFTGWKPARAVTQWAIEKVR
ncbi:bifunctional cobalt-precorrin-7 (C(5))-methyltransferase/cobalt-precorrin-6B (C(15))-methyltransferase [soil metagenome]